MKAHLDINHSGTLGDETRQDIVFDEGASDVLEAILIDLYADPELACVREIPTNAYDSHVAAGNLRPIEVELPSALRQTFVVRDHGLGLDPDDIKRIFKYGASTKRDTDEAVGMLGLGLKAPLAYTSQFTVVAVKHGLKSTVLVTRNERGGGAYDIVDTCATTEPNGVEITIPTVGWSSICAKAELFFRYWERGTVLVNGVLPKAFPGPSDVVLDPDVIITRDAEVFTDIIVMGNVPYPVPFERTLTRDGRGDVHAVVRVPIGTVDFSPNRESLRLTKRTDETIHEASAFINAGLDRRMQNDVAAARSHLEALRIAARLRNSFFGTTSLRYQSEDVPEQFAIGHSSSFRWGGRYSGAKIKSGVMDAEEASDPKTLHVIGMKGAVLRQNIREKVKLYVGEQNLDVEQFLFYPEPPPDAHWLTGVMTVDYETDIKPIKLPTEERERVARPKGSYRVQRSNYDGGAVWTPATDIIALGRPCVYVTSSVNRGYHHVKEKLGGEVTLIVVEKNRVNALLRDIPSVMSLKAFAEALLSKFANVTPVEAFVSHSNVRRWDKNILSKLPMDRVLDPELRSLAAEIKHAMEHFDVVAYGNAVNLARRVGLDVSEVKYGVVIGRLFHLEQRYKLIEYVDGWKARSAMRELVQYVNAIYATTGCAPLQALSTIPKPKQKQRKSAVLRRHK